MRREPCQELAINLPIMRHPPENMEQFIYRMRRS
jgi:hypothetical protein